MRGKVLKHGVVGLENRITPAYAGKRKINGFCCICLEDHPRLCGEKICGLFRRYYGLGSPPPMRGKAAESL